MIDDGNILARLNVAPPQVLVSKVSCENESVVRGTDVEIHVHSETKTGVARKSRFRRKRCPADMPLAAPPRNPRRAPFGAWDPDPANPIHTGPATIVINRPRVRLVGIPRPTSVRIKPATVVVWPPVSIHIARLPDIAVVTDFAPVAIGFEVVVEKVHRDLERGGGRLDGCAE